MTLRHVPLADKLPQHQGHSEVMHFIAVVVVVVVSVSPVPTKWQCTQQAFFNNLQRTQQAFFIKLIVAIVWRKRKRETDG